MSEDKPTKKASKKPVKAAKKAAKKATKKPAKATKKATKKSVKKSTKKVAKKSVASKVEETVEVKETKVVSKPEEKMAKAIDLDDHPPKPYLQIFGLLAVLTLIEVGIGTFDTSPGKVFLLLVLAVAKAGLVAAVFMHVWYDKNPRLIVIISFIIPIIGALFLGLTVWADYRT